MAERRSAPGRRRHARMLDARRLDGRGHGVRLFPGGASLALSAPIDCALRRHRSERVGPRRGQCRAGRAAAHQRSSRRSAAPPGDRERAEARAAGAAPGRAAPRRPSCGTTSVTSVGIRHRLAELADRRAPGPARRSTGHRSTTCRRCWSPGPTARRRRSGCSPRWPRRPGESPGCAAPTG